MTLRCGVRGHAAQGPRAVETVRQRLDDYLDAGATEIIVWDLGDPLAVAQTLVARPDLTSYAVRRAPEAEPPAR